MTFSENPARGFMPSDPQVRTLQPGDVTDWLRMRIALWPECPGDDHQREMGAILASPREIVLGWQRAGGRLGGFAELSLRERVDGCDSSPVAYLEGWYVDPDLRRQHAGSRLVAAAEEWARSQNCVELASDCDLTNDLSRQAHLATGFFEIARQIHFKKRLE